MELLYEHNVPMSEWANLLVDKLTVLTRNIIANIPSMITVTCWEQKYKRDQSNRGRRNSFGENSTSASVSSQTSGSGIVRCVVPEDRCFSLCSDIPYDINLTSLDISDLFVSDFSEEEHLVEEGV
eukprot:Nk52_evm1s1200 gene=Nk52_evmTU1s1200